MPIRSTVKALIVRQGRILLNRCAYEDGSVYYDLPGGGQCPYESLEAALRREVLEETGYTLGEIRFAALAEEIFTDPHLQARYPEYTHRMMHIFLSEPGDEPPLAPTEKDLGMVESLWLPLEEAARLKELHPFGLGAHLLSLAEGGAPIFLGTHYNHRARV